MAILNQKPMSIWIIIIRDRITEETYTHYQGYESSETARREAQEIEHEDETISCTIRKIKLSPKVRERLTVRVTAIPPEPFLRIISNEKPMYGTQMMQHHYPASVARSVMETLYELEQIRLAALYGTHNRPPSTLVFDMVPSNIIELDSYTSFKHPYDPGAPTIDEIPY